MLKYLGSVGAFIRLNDSENKTYRLLEVFSSSAASELLFSASVNNLNGSVRINTASTSIYINGNTASVLPSQQWAHLTLSFDNKLWTYDSNNFLIRFGDTASSNFNIQNLYMLEASTSLDDAEYLHYSFTGAGGNVIRVTDTASCSINVIDYPENNFISASSNVIYQPLKDQKRYLTDITALSELSLISYVSASVLSADLLYVDGFQLSEGDKVLSVLDDQIYQLTGSSQLITISSSVGDFIKVISGNQFKNSFLIKTNEGFIFTNARQKIDYMMNVFN